MLRRRRLRPAERVVKFDNGRGTAEQSLRKGKWPAGQAGLPEACVIR